MPLLKHYLFVVFACVLVSFVNAEAVSYKGVETTYGAEKKDGTEAKLSDKQGSNSIAEKPKEETKEEP